MERADFDPRYPAEFQPGGDSLPRVFSPPAEAPWTEGTEPEPESEPKSAPFSASASAVVGGDVEPVDPGREEPANAEPVTAGPVVVGLRPWPVRTWVLGLGAGVVTVLIGVLCLLPKEAPGTVPPGGNSLLMSLFFPLTDKLLALAPFIIIAGLAMLLAMFLGGAPRHPRASLVLRSAAALVAAVALAAAGLCLFAVSLHPEVLRFMFGPQEGAIYTYPWLQLTTVATMPLALFGLFAGAAVAIVRPNGGGRNSLSAARAAATGVGLLVGAAVTFYAPQIFTQSMFGGTYRQGGVSMQLTPWPVTLIQVGPYLLLVALSALLLALFLRLTNEPVKTFFEPAGDSGPLD